MKVSGGSSLEVDYYYLLGIEENASSKEIRSAYRRMAEIYHPDKLRELPEERKEEGQEIMRLLNEAKAILLDPEKREQYDRRIGAGMEPEEVIIVERSSKQQGRPMVAIEKETMARKMSRVLDSMKDVFVKDKEFQTKIAVAEEVFEAQIIDDEEEDEAEDIMVLDEDQEDGDQEVEMKLEFTVVPEDGDRKVDRKQNEKSSERKFRILAIEGDDSDEITEDDEVDVEWE